MILLKNILWVGAGGMIGSVLRYLISLFTRNDLYPYATFMVNVSGSLIIGLIMAIAGKYDGSGNWRLFLATGVCGGFTTFSAFAWENLQFLQQGKWGNFVIYTGSSIVLGMLAVGIGYWLGKQL